jgi:hypothetical protein
VKTRWQHFRAGWERFSLLERLLLAVLFLTLLTVWFVGPHVDRVEGYRWHLPLRHTLNYYTK